MNNREVASYSEPLVSNISKGVAQWIETLWDESGMLACNKPTRIHCKAGSVSTSLVFETRGKCQYFVVRYMVVIQSTVPSAVPTLIQCVNPDQLKSERSENNSCHYGKSWLTNLKFFS